MTRFLLRSALTVAAMLALYAVIPVPGQRMSPASTLVFAVAGLAGLAAALLVMADHARKATDQDVVRLEVLVAVLYAFVVFVSLVYLALASKPGEFTGLGNRVDALYFTMSTVATVGYGDVHPVGRAARAVVTAQIFFDVVILALVVKTILPKVGRGRLRHHEPEDPDAGA